MLSIMESKDELREQERVAQRAEAAPYVDYPSTPWWYMPAMGLWALVATVVMTRHDNPQAVRICGEVALIGAAFALVGWQRRIRGVWPTGKAPAEIRRVMGWFIVGAVVVIAAVLGVRAWLGVWVAASVAFVIVTAAVTWYEAAYARAAAAVRERLA